MKGGMNFEEWKAVVKKNRQPLNTKSNTYKFEPESLTYGGPGADKKIEYGQIHTITYTMTGMEASSDWPTEIKSGKTLNITVTAPEGYEISSVSASADYTYDSNKLTVEDI